MSNTTPREVDYHLPHFRFAAKEWGPQDGRPLLAFHGWLDNANTFDAIAPALDTHRLICLDLPGHGCSQHYSPNRSYSFIDTVSDVCHLIEEQHWDSLDLLGHSLGAGVAPFVAATFPDVVGKLVMIDGIGPLSGHASEGPAQLRNSLQTERRTRKSHTRVYAKFEEAVEHRLKATQALTGGMDRESVVTLLNRGLEEVDGGYTWRADPRLRLPSRNRLTEEQVVSFLQAVECSSLLILGDTGFEGIRPMMGDRISAMRHLTTVQLSGGHHLHLDNPTLVAERLSAFLSS